MSSSKPKPKKQARAQGEPSRARAATRPATNAANREPPNGRERVQKPAKNASPGKPAPNRSATPARTAPKPPGATPAPPGSQPSYRQLPAPKPLPAKPAVPAPRPGIRLAGTRSSRLTIKPTPQVGPRPQLALSTKVRPPGQRRLSEVELDEDEILIDGFDAVLNGEKVRVTAVLERTCVYISRTGDRQLARKEELMIEADKLPIRRRGPV